MKHTEIFTMHSKTTLRRARLTLHFLLVRFGFFIAATRSMAGLTGPGAAEWGALDSRARRSAAWTAPGAAGLVWMERTVQKICRM